MQRFAQDRVFWLVVAAILVAFVLLQARSALGIAYIIVSLLVAVTVHECSHAWAALRLGDDTAAARGRISLNPLVHLDPLGTVMMVITALTGFGLGWGKPVPVAPYRLRYGPRVGNGLVSLAGPLSNILLAAALGLAVRLSGNVVYALPWLADLLVTVVMLNLVIAVFNLLPIPPLDGYSVLIGLLALPRTRWGHQAANTLESWNRFGMLLLFGLILFSQFMGLNLLGRLVGQPALALYRVILGG
jgi:Zn-dependent protease